MSSRLHGASHNQRYTTPIIRCRCIFDQTGQIENLKPKKRYTVRPTRSRPRHCPSSRRRPRASYLWCRSGSDVRDGSKLDTGVPEQRFGINLRVNQTNWSRRVSRLRDHLSHTRLLRGPTSPTVDAGEPVLHRRSVQNKPDRSQLFAKTCTYGNLRHKQGTPTALFHGV